MRCRASNVLVVQTWSHCACLALNAGERFSRPLVAVGSPNLSRNRDGRAFALDLSYSAFTIVHEPPIYYQTSLPGGLVPIHPPGVPETTQSNHPEGSTSFRKESQKNKKKQQGAMLEYARPHCIRIVRLPGTSKSKTCPDSPPQDIYAANGPMTMIDIDQD